MGGQRLERQRVVRDRLVRERVVRNVLVRQRLVRRGVVRGYVDYLSEGDIRYIDQVIAEVGDLFDSEGLKVE